MMVLFFNDCLWGALKLCPIRLIFHEDSLKTLFQVIPMTLRNLRLTHFISIIPWVHQPWWCFSLSSKLDPSLADISHQQKDETWYPRVSKECDFPQLYHWVEIFPLRSRLSLPSAHRCNLVQVARLPQWAQANYWFQLDTNRSDPERNRSHGLSLVHIGSQIYQKPGGSHSLDGQDRRALPLRTTVD